VYKEHGAKAPLSTKKPGIVNHYTPATGGKQWQM